MNHKFIYVYKDEGVGLVNANYLWKELKKAGYDQSHQLRWVLKEDFLKDNWEDQTDAIIMPGGRDLPYHEALKGEANFRIRNFVVNGGSYLGICAGAYYGCANLEFDLGQSLEVKGERELKFFPGLACGPAFGQGTFCYMSAKGAKVAKLRMHNGSILFSYFNGGCYFDQASSLENVKVLARYLEIPHEPAAIVYCKVGKGKAILSGVHPEVGSSSLYSSDPFFKNIQPQLEAIEDQRQLLLQSLFRYAFQKNTDHADLQEFDEELQRAQSQ